VTQHFTDDDLTLYYYGEGRRRHDIERHLESCAPCAATYREIAGTLAMVAAPEVPERGDQYGLEVWQRIRHKLPEPGFSRFSRFWGFGEFSGFGLAAIRPYCAAVTPVRAHCSIVASGTTPAHGSLWKP